MERMRRSVGCIGCTGLPLGIAYMTSTLWGGRGVLKTDEKNKNHLICVIDKGRGYNMLPYISDYLSTMSWLHSHNDFSNREQTWSRCRMRCSRTAWPGQTRPWDRRARPDWRCDTRWPPGPGSGQDKALITFNNCRSFQTWWTFQRFWIHFR